MKHINKALVLALLASIPATTAWAQSSLRRPDLGGVEGSGMFGRERNTSVRERNRPDYEAIGGRVGAFMVYPKVEIESEFTDNLYATSNGKVSEFIYRIQPEAEVQSNWSRHALRMHGGLGFNQFTERGQENTNDWEVGTDARIDIQRGSSITLGALAINGTEPRTSTATPASAAEPVQFTTGQFYFGASRAVGRVKLTGRADYRKYDFISVRSLAGDLIDENDRDREYVSVSGRVDYAVSPDSAIFVEVSGNKRDYRKDTILLPARDSEGYQVLAGMNFDLTNLLRGEIGVGYTDQNFDNPLYGDKKGFAARATVEWFPTELTTFTASAARAVEDSPLQGAGGYLSTSAGARVDHELRRNVILTANSAYSHERYREIDRTDKRWTAGMGVTYLINRTVGVNANYLYFKQDSSGAAARSDYHVNRLVLGLVIQY